MCRPLIIYMTARVASRSGMRSLTMSRAFISPTIAPIARETIMTIYTGCSYQIISVAAATVVRDTVEPTDRSKPSTIWERVTPMATKVTIAMELRISVKLSYVKKYGSVIEK
ncbi:hypothetical protein D1872_239540 [compost metagenome]